MTDNIEKFISLGGTFEIGIHCTDVIYNGKRMSVPNNYFTSTNEEHREVLNYYLEMLPKLMDNKGPPVILGFPEDLDLLTTCGTFDTNDCISYEDMRNLFKVKEIKDETTGD
jgi:hypothetical protein